MQTLVEIGHSNASQVQNWKKDATEQMKNLTLARTRTQVAVISSADALATKQRVPVAEPESLSLQAFRSYIHSVAFSSCGLFLHMLLLSVFFHNLSSVDFII